MNKLFDEMRRLGAAEAVDFNALLEQDDGRKSAHLVFPGQFHVFTRIDFELGQQYLAIEGFDHAGQDRRNDDTGAAPVGPEIDQHRLLKRCIYNLLVKIFESGFENKGLDF